ncbi:MAG: T9SS type A sorting domain-containing protein [Fibrobacteres bacterium]|nr:T9SS type A sorting domain-containing protein [Fibrobacterota bacterium]
MGTLFTALSAILCFSISALGSTQPIQSNGFNHIVTWNSADSSFYHICTQGIKTETHLVHKYTATALSKNDTISKIGSAGVFRDTTYRNSSTGAWHFFRNDTQIVIDTLEYYTSMAGGNMVLKDTLIAVKPDRQDLFSGLDDLAAGDYLIINGKRVPIVTTQSIVGSTTSRIFWVKASGCPTGAKLSLNGTTRTLPQLKTFSSDNASNYTIIADPNRKNKLYFFYISDSGRIVGQVTWDDGLTWEELFESSNNAMLSQVNILRTSLSASIISSGVITLSWSEQNSGALQMTFIVPTAVVDTVVMYVRPTGVDSDDARFTNVTEAATFKTVMTPSTAFTSIDRCFNQIIMLENGITHSQLLDYSKSDTAMGKTRAVLTRFYNIRMLPGEYQTNWGDRARSSNRIVPWNVLFSPGWERSIKIESHYTNPDSQCVINVQPNNYETNFGSGIAAANGNNFMRTWSPFAVGGTYGNNIRLERWFPSLSHIEISGLKFTGTKTTKETGVSSAVAFLADGVNINGIRFINNIFYSQDSTDYYTMGKRKLSTIFASSYIVDKGVTSPVDNIVFAGNIMHRLNNFNSGYLSQSVQDYSGGMIFVNNSLYKWANSDIWSSRGMIGKVICFNNITDSAPNPYTSRFSYRSGFISSDSGNNIYAFQNQFRWLDTIPNTSYLHRIHISSPAAESGKKLLAIASIRNTDLYGIPNGSLQYVGATVSAPDNPISLQVSFDTLHTPGSRTIKVNILNKGLISAAIDTIKIFRNPYSYVRNPYSVSDVSYDRASLPELYYSANVPETYYSFTVAVGVKQNNGNVNWSNIDPVLNGARIMLCDCSPPYLAFTISNIDQGTLVSKDSIAFKVFSPFSRGLVREPDIKKVFVFMSSDSASLITSLRDTTQRKFEYQYIAQVHPFLGTIYNDTSSTFVAKGLKPNTRYFIAAVSMDSSANLCLLDSVKKYIVSFTTKGETDAETITSLVPVNLELGQNSPNPFNPVTKIAYAIPHSGQMSLKIYSYSGKLLKTVFEGKAQPGYYEASVKTNNLSSGTYIYRIKLGNKILTRAMTVVK